MWLVTFVISGHTASFVFDNSAKPATRVRQSISRVGLCDANKKIMGMIWKKSRQSGPSVNSFFTLQVATVGRSRLPAGPRATDSVSAGAEGEVKNP